jgi:hypothetical protein
MVVNQEATALEGKILARLNGATEIALRMLPKMIVEDGPHAGLFCQKIKNDGRGGLIVEGASIPYSLIALIGVAATFGNKALEGEPWSTAAGVLDKRFAEKRLSVPELALMLWLDEYRGGGSAVPILRALEGGWETGRRYMDTMEAAWILAGLTTTHALAESQLARKVLGFLLASYNPVTHLFALGGNPTGQRWGGRRMNRVLGSFASQVYPILALSRLVELNKDPRLAEILRSAAAKTCQLQGSQGEWWWIFDTRKGTVFLDYPVYSVHQDAMGPMALLAASRALQAKDYLPAISRGLEYLFKYRNPQSGDGFIDQQNSIIWRAVVKDVPGEDPADTAFGVGAVDAQRMRSAGRPWRIEKEPLRASGYRVLQEARPYCPGWILFAFSQACGLFGSPVSLELPTLRSCDPHSGER